MTPASVTWYIIDQATAYYKLIGITSFRLVQFGFLIMNNNNCTTLGIISFF